MQEVDDLDYFGDNELASDPEHNLETICQ